MYHPWWVPAPAPMRTPCTHDLTCTNTATHTRGGFPVCFDHWLIEAQWEQPRITHEESAA